MRVLTIKPDGKYAKKELEHAYVYFNKYDIGHKRPLLFSLHFKNEKPLSKFMYLQYSEFNSFLRLRSIEMFYMTEVENDNELFRVLISENYYTNNILTYYINKIGEENKNINYNPGPISISKKENVETVSQSEFYKHTHTPKYRPRKSYVLYNRNVLTKGDKAPIKEIQGQVYSSITVYFGKRAKSSGGKDIPLLIELNKQTPTNDPEYYVHKRKDKEYYWEQLPGDSNGKVLCELLTDMGFGMNRGDTGYEQLKQLLSKPGVLNGHEGETDLSTKLAQVKGEKLKNLLKEKVGQNGSSKSFLVLLLQKIEFDLLDSVVILLEKNSSNKQYGELDIADVVSKLDPIREIKTVDMSSKQISVTDATENKGKCVKNYKYKVYEHDFSKVVNGLGQNGKSAVGIRFIMPSQQENQYKQLALYSAIDKQAEPNKIVYNYYQKNGESTSNSDKVYVWFYNGGDGAGKGDPRPLIICYGGNTYAPRTIGTYFTQWAKVDLNSGSAGFKDCGCSSAHVSDDKNNLLKELDKVVKFLNKVNLKEGTSTSGGSGTHTYDVQTFKGQKIQIKVTCSPVGSEPPSAPGTCSTSPSPSCYKKFMHTPAGMNGGDSSSPIGSGYRLGEVQYRTNGGGSGQVKGTLNYKTLTSKYKYHPLVGVTVYYYDQDTDYNDPLLIELEFKTNGVGGGVGAGPKEYYKLTTGGGDSTGEKKWTKDDEASGKMGNNTTAVEHLDSIRYSLKKVMKILIDKQGTYPLCLSNDAGGSGKTYGPQNGNTIQVSEYNTNGCQELAEKGYKCYVHKVSEINGSGTFDYNEVGGLKFYISGKGEGGTDDIEIKLYKENNGEGDPGNGKIEQITYNKCMKNIYVFFYNQDKPPLMLFYDKNWFVPIDRDEYFEMWKHENTLGDKKPCIGNYDMIKTHLDLTNRKLNRIELTHDMSSKTSSTYGIPPPNNPPNKPEINLERVQVTKIPSKPTDNRPYVKLVHRTSNSFSIGDIYYDGQDITNGVTINCSPSVSGSDKITVDTNEDGTKNHTQFVTTSNPNTVIAYYSSEDKNHTLPQLIVLLQTDQPIPDGTDPIKASDRTNYGYYVLATGKDAGSYKYEWRTPSDTGTQLTLDDKTEFRLLNAIVIMVDKTTQYDEGVISGAVKSTGIKSPGNTENDVNRLKQKMINLPEQTGASAERYGNPGKCVSQYGYRLWAHDITTLVTWTGSSGQPSIPLIGGFRFLIPSSENATGYQEINLYKDDTAKEPAERLYHSPTGDQNRKNKVYVFFYNKDPRPLLMCYGGNAYIPQKLNEPISYKQVDVDYKKWIRERKITDCVCLDPRTADNDGNILDALLNVVLFLNPVQINPTKIPSHVSAVITATKKEQPTTRTYKLHQYKASSHVKMKITRTDICCYEQYKYEPAGTNGSTGKNGDGFRLGTVFYTSVGGDKPIATLNYYELSPSSKYNPLLRVTVYYYYHDTKYTEPLFMELEFNTNGDVVPPANPKEYYQLKTLINSGGTDMSWAKDEDAVGKFTGDHDNQKLFNHLDTIRYLFKKVLEVRIAIKNTESYKAKMFNTKGTPVTPEYTLMYRFQRNLGVHPYPIQVSGASNMVSVALSHRTYTKSVV